jgi:hypothetical protein
MHIAFVVAGEDAPVIDVVEFNADDHKPGDLATSLAAFRLYNARCYDPNEERRLRRAIEATPGGESEFESKICGLATFTDPAAAKRRSTKHVVQTPRPHYSDGMPQTTSLSGAAPKVRILC